MYQSELAELIAGRVRMAMTPETKSVGALSTYTRSCASSFPTRIRSPNITYAGNNLMNLVPTNVR
jgi:hypothetical protein